MVSNAITQHVLFLTYCLFAVIALAGCIRDAAVAYSSARLMQLSIRAPIVIDDLRGPYEGDGM